MDYTNQYSMISTWVAASTDCPNISNTYVDLASCDINSYWSDSSWQLPDNNILLPVQPISIYNRKTGMYELVSWDEFLQMISPKNGFNRLCNKLSELLDNPNTT